MFKYVCLVGGLAAVAYLGWCQRPSKSRWKVLEVRARAVLLDEETGATWYLRSPEAWTPIPRESSPDTTGKVAGHAALGANEQWFRELQNSK